MEVKMEKEPDSLATVQMKPEYAPSEYSSSSEPPPAYKLRQANSVKIAKIIAFTVILSSFILGGFILATTYISAKSSCDQVQALDAVLDKELMLEALQQDMPRSEALMSREANNYNNLQDLSKDEMNKPNRKDTTNPEDVETLDNSDSSSDSESNSEESNDQNRIHIKMPLDLDLSDLAHAVLMNNQKSKMNCVVERRKAEEFIDAPSKTMQLPFGVNLTTDPKRQKVTGERIAIFCETGEMAADKPKQEEQPEFRRIVMPFQGMPPRFGPPPMQYPQMQQMQFQNIPQQQFGPPMAQNQYGQQMTPQFPPQMQMHLHVPQQMQPPQPQPQMIRFPPIPAQMMQAPRPEVPEFRMMHPQQSIQQQFENQNQEQQAPQPEVRIHLRRIQIPGNLGDIFPMMNNINNDLTKQDQNQQNQQQVHVQQVPLQIALQKVGITADDLRNIQRMAEERFRQEIQELVADDESSNESEDNQSEDQEPQTTETTEASNSQQSEQQSEQSHQEINEATSNSQQQSQELPQILPLGRAMYGRSLALSPVRIPVPMVMNDAEVQEAEGQRAHYVHPRK